MSHPLEWNAVIATAQRLVAREYPDEGYHLVRDYSDSTGLCRVNVGRLETKMQVKSDSSIQEVQAFKTLFQITVEIPLDPNPMYDIVRKPDDFGQMTEMRKHHAPIPNAEQGGRKIAAAILAELDDPSVAAEPERKKPGPKPRAKAAPAPAGEDVTEAAHV